MDLCKLFTMQALFLCSFTASLVLPKILILKLNILLPKALLINNTSKALTFFLCSITPLINTFIYFLIGDIQGKKSRKIIRLHYYECMAMHLITFICIINGYIFKVEFEILLRKMFFISLNLQIFFIGSLFNFTSVKYFFIFNVLISNFLILGYTFLVSFDVFVVRKVYDINRYFELMRSYFFRVKEICIRRVLSH